MKAAPCSWCDPMTILIVDDNTRMRGMIRSLLSAPGVECYECGDGVSAIQFYRACRPDWVVMDIKLPGANGIRATQEILREDPRARIAIVTNFEDPEYREAAIKAGARAYVLKEDLSQLRDVLLPSTTENEP
jgi:DNA-binding NarL/FixJ family response regulator